jgi:hypothetical protein
MKILVRAVISGFGFSLGAALYKRVSKRLGWDEPDQNERARNAAATDGDADGVPDAPAVQRA